MNDNKFNLKVITNDDDSYLAAFTKYNKQHEFLAADERQHSNVVALTWNGNVKRHENENQQTGSNR